MTHHTHTKLLIALALLFSASAVDARGRTVTTHRRASTRHHRSTHRAIVHWGPKQVHGPRLLVHLGAFSKTSRLAKALGTGQRVIVRAKLSVAMPDTVARKTASRIAEKVRRVTSRQENAALAHTATHKADRVPAVKKPLLVFDIGLGKTRGHKNTSVNMTAIGFTVRAAISGGADVIRVPAGVSKVAITREVVRAGAGRRVSVISSLQELMGVE